MTQLSPPTPRSPDAKDNNMVLILVAVALAIVTVVLTHIYITNIRKQVEGEMEIVYRLKQSYKVGDKLREQDLTETRMRKEAVAEHGSYITRQELSAWLTQPVLRAVRQGEYLTWDIFTSSSQGADLRITPGMKECPIQIASEGRPGTLEPGMIVDVYAPVTVPGQSPQAMLVIEKVRVLSVGNRAIGSTGSKSSSANYSGVTLEVDPPIVKQLFSIQQWLGRGEFLLSVRNPGDSKVEIVDGGINPELLKLMAAPVPDTRNRTR